MKTLYIIDLDDTLFDLSHREHILEKEFNTSGEKWSAFFEACDGDKAIDCMVKAVQCIPQDENTKVVFLTGRSNIGQVRAKTQKQLKDNGLSGPLFLRPAGSFMKSGAFKRKVFDKHFAGKFDKVIVVDDDVNVIDAFKDIAECLLVNTDNHEETALALHAMLPVSSVDMTF